MIWNYVVFFGKVGLTLNRAYLSTKAVYKEHESEDLQFKRVQNYAAVPIYLDIYPFKFLAISPGMEFGYLVSANFINEAFNAEGNAYD